MPELEIRDDAQAIVVGDFRLTFRWTGDRWAHELEHRGPRDPRFLAWSFETAPEHEEPSRVICPAFQQLDFQTVGEKTQALLVGQSGPHHFSAVFEVSGRQHPKPAGWPQAKEGPKTVSIKVEVADRCRAPVASLASTYRVAADPGQLAAGSSDLSAELLLEGPEELQWGFGPNLLTFLAFKPCHVSFAEDGRRATRVQAVASADPGQLTQIWTYYWQWSTDFRRAPSIEIRS